MPSESYQDLVGEAKASGGDSRERKNTVDSGTDDACEGEGS